MASGEFRGLTRRFGATAAADDVSLRIEHGRLVCLLDAPGCGKTATLRLIVGFIEPTAGQIVIGEHVVSSPVRTVPPEDRNMSMSGVMTAADLIAVIVFDFKERGVTGAIAALSLAMIVITTVVIAIVTRAGGSWREAARI